MRLIGLEKVLMAAGLLIVEKVQGPLSKFERTWLVQCKHKAHSGKSVGREDSYSIVTDCKSA